MKKNFVCFAKLSERTNLAITTQTASARNDSTHNPLPLGEPGEEQKGRLHTCGNADNISDYWNSGGIDYPDVNSELSRKSMEHCITSIPEKTR